MTDLWSCNHPRRFWLLQPDPPENIWQEAIRLAMPVLELPTEPEDVETALALTLGEGRFGSDHFKLNFTKRFYYQLKPLIPRTLIHLLKQVNARYCRAVFPLRWPVEDRYARFQWEIIRQLLTLTGETHLAFRHFWPDGKQFALVLTHDIESAQGLANVRRVADLEEELGFRSSFNFVAERYPLDYQLMDELRDRDFEIGVHGLKHDGKLFNSHSKFMERAKRINYYLNKFSAVGFRSPLTLRNPKWMQALDIEYDLSFFDTDPYEPLPGGVMSIWPFIIGRFVELPYTLPQDCTLGMVLGETTTRLWEKKLEFIARYCGMAFLNTHPDYLAEPRIRKIYVDFLQIVNDKSDYWHALPVQVARWWRSRSSFPMASSPYTIVHATVSIEDNLIAITLPPASQRG